MGAVEGKVAFISGIARGQGRSHAVKLASEGADIVGFDVLEPNDSASYSMATKEDLDQTVSMVEAAGARCLVSQADVRDREAVQAVADQALEMFGHIDTVIANAGIAVNGASFWKIPPSVWAEVLAVNLTGVWNTVSAAVPAMIEADQGGSVILTSSGAGLRAAPNLAAYNSSKHGVVGLMKTMANELAPHRIRVNALCPSTVSTPMIMNDRLYRLFRPDLENPTMDDAIPTLAAMNPLGEPWVEAIDISNFVLWLASDQSWYMTGVAVPLDLGLANKW